MFRAFLLTTALFVTSCITVQSLAQMGRTQLGLETKVRFVDGHEVITHERPGDPLVVFVHGFTGDHTNFLPLVARIPDDWGVLMMDLPGHGETTPRDEGADYSISSQRVRLSMLLEQRGRAKVHLVGNSMGGAIALDLALNEPRWLKSLTLIDSAGVTSPAETDAIAAFRRGENPYRVESKEDLERFLALVFHKPPALPDNILSYLAQARASETEWHEKLRRDLKDLTVVNDRLHMVRTPTLVLWGEYDRVVHPSAAKVFAEGIAEAELFVAKDCGHIPNFECPDKIAPRFVRFVQRVERARRAMSAR